MKALIAVALIFLLSACVSPSTEEIGANVGNGAVMNPPGQNSFHATFDPNNPGVPMAVSLANGKDEEGILLDIVYANADGSSVTWRYQVARSSGSTQTAAITAALQAVAEVQGTTVEALAPGVVQSVTALVQAALSVPPQ